MSRGIKHVCLDRFSIHPHKDACSSSTHPPRLPHFFSSPSSPTLHLLSIYLVSVFPLLCSLSFLIDIQRMRGDESEDMQRNSHLDLVSEVCRELSMYILYL